MTYHIIDDYDASFLMATEIEANVAHWFKNNTAWREISRRVDGNMTIIRAEFFPF